jgi:cell cycle checkpoint control protein RAD9A
MSLSLAANFFEEYDVFDCAVAQAVALFKHALAVFRTQRIARLEFELRVAEGRIEITLHCDNGAQRRGRVPPGELTPPRGVRWRALAAVFSHAHSPLPPTSHPPATGLVKRYAFTTVEGDVLQATADRGALAVRVVAETDAMARLLDTFHSSLSEVTITAGAESAPSAGGAGGGSGSGPAPGRAVQLRSYVDPARGGGDGALHTLLSLDASVAFVSYAHTGEGLVEATFNVRDFRAMLALCAGLDCPVAISFQGPGSPLVAEPELGADGDLEAELIVATLVTEGEAPQQAAAPQPAPAAAPAAPPPRQDWAQLAAPGAPPGAAPDSRERGELLRTEAARLQAAYARGGGGGGGGRPGSDPLDAAIPSTPPEEQPAAGPSALPGSAAQPGVIATAMDK